MPRRSNQGAPKSEGRATILLIPSYSSSPGRCRQPLQGSCHSPLQLLPGSRGSHQSSHRQKESTLEFCRPSITPRILSLPRSSPYPETVVLPMSQVGKRCDHQWRDGRTEFLHRLWLRSPGCGSHGQHGLHCRRHGTYDLFIAV